MSRWPSLVATWWCLSSVLACEIEIGDECTSAADCSQEEPRLCLTQALEGYPGGYCTIFNCEPGTCPAEAACIGYRSNLASGEECRDAFGATRLQRTFCMRTCNASSDCRSGYECIDVSGDDPWGAEVLERPGKGPKVCALPYSGPAFPDDREGAVCESDPGAVPAPTAPMSAGPDAAPNPQTDANAPVASGDGGIANASAPSDASVPAGDAEDGGARGDASVPSDDAGSPVDGSLPASP